MRVYLQALGCRLNEAELETWSQDWRQRGHALCTSAEDADLVVINSCAVTAESVRKSRQLVRRAQRGNPAAKLVVSGCYASLDAADGGTGLAELGVDLVVPNTEKDRLVEITCRELDLPVMPEAATEPAEQTLFQRGRQRAFIKVQDGCRYRCTFCIVTRARGEERSRPIGEIVDEINRHHAGGVNEVVLAGVHLGGYGSDRDTHLRELVQAVLADTDVPRIRLGSLEPWELHDDFWSLFDDNRLMPHLHLPIQSGADSVLRRMARRCRTDEFAALVDQARAAIPAFNVTTDIIVGFPGETDAEWAETLAFAERMSFGHIHIFAYSARAGTKAAGLPDPVARDTKRERSQQLHAVARQSSRAVLEKAIGKIQPVLVEQRAETDDATWLGYTPSYLRVEVAATDGRDLSNRIVDVELRALNQSGDRLTGLAR
ncbi:MAG: tRNA (N(6)-L-threonylcarbamoyladenosine(37)-C(2))-methylthiotransferase MtaB [Chromatiaceae bacterium]|jgi:threonylcarbamoyladenosine tRNA methylthiotransferase MtaB